MIGKQRITPAHGPGDVSSRTFGPVLLVLAATLGCPSKAGPAEPTHEHAHASPEAKPEAAAPDDAPTPVADPHRVVFADRTSQAYLLLVDAAHSGPVARDALADLVRRKLSAPEREPEVALLVDFVETPPLTIDPKLVASAQAPSGSPRETSDLLGLHVEVLPRSGPSGPVIAPAVLRDPILTRELEPHEHTSLPTRTHAILLRADYRNRFGVRGLRLLQTVVELLAAERAAVIHDPDTGETMSAKAFSRRRLLSSLGNVADQVAVVPFADPRHGEGYVRLSTRGMRRFGSADLEIDGLARDPVLLQRATDLLYGLGYDMVQLGEFDASGYSVELDEVVTVTREHVERAYGQRRTQPPACDDCPEEVDVHLVERAAEPHDPNGHVVVRVVAPRPTSDAAGYDHPAWVRRAVAEVFGE